MIKRRPLDTLGVLNFSSKYKIWEKLEGGKMKKLICLIFAIVLIVSISHAGPLLWRGAKTIPSGKPIGMIGLGYCTINKSYNWADEEWTDIPDDSQTDVISTHFMLGYAPINKWEIMAHIPVMSKSRGDLSTTGLQDAWVKMRYNLMGGKEQPYVTAVLAGRFPTASKAEDVDIPLDDRTVDIAAGALFMYNMAPLVFHLKAGYWYNMKNEADVDVGDNIEGIFKIDYVFTKKMKAFLNFSFVETMQAKDADGNSIDNSEKRRLNIIPGLVVKPMPGLSIRPKFIYPLEMVCKGSSNFAWKLGLDIWFVP